MVFGISHWFFFRWPDHQPRSYRRRKNQGDHHAGRLVRAFFLCVKVKYDTATTAFMKMQW